MGSAARSIAIFVVLGLLMGCATASSMNTDLEKGPLGSRTQMTTPLNATTGPRIELPLESAGQKPSTFATYIRIHGRGKTRRIVMDRRGQTSCMPGKDAAPGECPEISAEGLGDTLIQRMMQRGLHPTQPGIGPGADLSKDLNYDLLNYSVFLFDWKEVDAAIAVVDEVLLEYDVAHSLGITVTGIDVGETL
ncbi:hypothetical protein [Corallococcus sp. EGB]|uniref:hypothetical protein n=1 Tax=Corallococcus sp. EGB TaxID=1521117 RepID=UPI001CBCBA70|nr:hypothetical protein [Corallococcus sp. EGB]